jgi:hypothetical protein
MMGRFRSKAKRAKAGLKRKLGMALKPSETPVIRDISVGERGVKIRLVGALHPFVEKGMFDSQLSPELREELSKVKLGGSFKRTVNSALKGIDYVGLELVTDAEGAEADEIARRGWGAVGVNLEGKKVFNIDMVGKESYKRYKDYLTANMEWFWSVMEDTRKRHEEMVKESILKKDVEGLAEAMKSVIEFKKRRSEVEEISKKDNEGKDDLASARANLIGKLDLMLNYYTATHPEIKREVSKEYPLNKIRSALMAEVLVHKAKQLGKEKKGVVVAGVFGGGHLDEVSAFIRDPGTRKKILGQGVKDMPFLLDLIESYGIETDAIKRAMPEK